MRWLELPIGMDGLDKSGIYAIWCVDSGRPYVGSAVLFYRRMAKHRACLRGGYHDNKFLQNAYDKYGESRFSFEVLEVCEKDRLIERENFWIAQLGAHESDSGMNMLPAGGTRLGSKFTDDQKFRMSTSLLEVHRNNPEIGRRSGAKRKGRKCSAIHVSRVVDKTSKWFGLRSPSGINFIGKNVAAFCREHNLSKSAISQILSGKYRGSAGPLDNYKGWTKIK